MLLFPCFGIERTSKPNLKLQQSLYLSPLTLYAHCLIRHVLLPDSRHGLRSTHLSSMPISLIGDVRCRVSSRAFFGCDVYWNDIARESECVCIHTMQ